MVTAAPRTHTTPTPVAPKRLEESGLSIDLLLQLTLKTLYFAGRLSGTELARRLCLNFPVIEPAIDQLVTQRHVAIVDGGLIGRSSFTYEISDAGRQRAVLFLENNHYTGAAPVPLKQYAAYMAEREQGERDLVRRDALREAVARKLVVSDDVLNQLGPALNSRHSLFLYGPPGNGKSVIAAAMGTLLAGGIEIPHALEVEGNIIRLFDPVHHDPLPVSNNEPDTLDSSSTHDDRWIRCASPIVTVGGELELASLDLAFDDTVGFYRAPVQTKANGGILIIDDFGRQRCSPQALLNRWIVPLEMRYDYLTLRTGQTITLPFSTFVVFATNIKPSELVDEAFLRRIRYKVYAQSPTVDEFMEIFERVCTARQVPFRRAEVEALLERRYRPHGLPLRGCHPRDLVEHVVSIAEFTDRPRELTAELLDTAWAGYFVREREDVGQDVTSSPTA